MIGIFISVYGRKSTRYRRYYKYIKAIETVFLVFLKAYNVHRDDIINLNFHLFP